jgi:hypothetical protein
MMANVSAAINSQNKRDIENRGPKKKKPKKENKAEASPINNKQAVPAIIILRTP